MLYAIDLTYSLYKWSKSFDIPTSGPFVFFTIEDFNMFTFGVDSDVLILPLLIYAIMDW